MVNWKLTLLFLDLIINSSFGASLPMLKDLNLIDCMCMVWTECYGQHAKWLVFYNHYNKLKQYFILND